jgi:predicted RND superfamily exporter protein
MILLEIIATVTCVQIASNYFAIICVIICKLIYWSIITSFQVDVTGLMYFWGLTIDTVSTVVIIIAVGLSVDYASHVGHTFLVKSGNRKGT